MKKFIIKYLKNIKLPSYHKIKFDGKYLKFCYQDLCLCGDIVFNNHDKISVVDIVKFKLDEISVKKMIDNFVKRAFERNKTRPNQIQILNDIEAIDYVNWWDFNYTDEMEKYRK